MHSHEAGTLQSLSNQGQQVVYYLKPASRPQAALVCLHGLASNATRWYEYLHASQLQNECHLLAMDLRGHGRAMTYRRYTRADWCADLGQVLNQYAVPGFIPIHGMIRHLSGKIKSLSKTKRSLFFTCLSISAK